MSPRRHQKLWAIAFGLYATTAQAAEPRAIGNFGAWKLVAYENAVTLQNNFSAAVSSTDGKAVIELICKKEIPGYAFLLENPELSVIPFGTDIKINARLSQNAPFQVVTVSTGDGKLVVPEWADNPSFSVLLVEMAKAADSIGFAVGEHQWLFPLAGFSRAIERLGGECGFVPDPAKARKNANRRQ